MTEQELYATLLAKMNDGIAGYRGYAELTRDVSMIHFTGKWDGLDPHTQVDRVLAGTTVRVTMVSKEGDMGITHKLNSMHAFGLRVMPGDGLLANCRLSLNIGETVPNDAADDTTNDWTNEPMKGQP